MSKSCITIQGLRHVYGQRVALDHLILNIPEGEIFALLGPNGSGKSTLFKVLSTLIPLQSGSVSILDHDLVQESPEIRRKIGVLFQSPALDKKLTVEENLRCAGHLYGLHGADLKSRIRIQSEALGISDRLGDFVEHLSGGLQRRVEIAKALLPEPRLLILDEPSTGLDPGALAACREIYRQLQSKGISILMTTHNMEEACRTDRVAILHRGVLVAEGAPKDLCESVGEHVAVLRCADVLAVEQEVAALPGHGTPRIIGDEIHIPSQNPHELAGRLSRKFGEGILSVTISRPTLEDVFAHKTGCTMLQAEDSTLLL